MSTISKEQLRERAREKVKSLEFAVTQTAFADSRPELEEELELARIALASLEAEPVAMRWRYLPDGIHGMGEWNYRDQGYIDTLNAYHLSRQKELLYTAPPVPVSVPAAYEHTEDFSEYHEGWNACRAAMLQGAGNSPVIPNDVRRMDWLVSKTVDVREPMVYGSHSLFWSQTITDEEDDYHATKLREQIDAAMVAEQVVAPQQEVKP